MTRQVLPMNVPSKRRADLLRLAARMAEEAELIGRRMAERREELGLTQREVAERMPGSTQASDVSRWERGKHRPEPMPQIAEALETTIADLVSGPLAERKAPENNDFSDALKASEGSAAENPQTLLRLEALQNRLGAELALVKAALEEQQSLLERVLRNQEESG